MSKAIYRRTYDGFMPANDDAALFFGKVKFGQLVTLDGKQARNLKFHRKFFAILRLISDNSRPHISEETALYLAKAAAGVGEWIDTGKRELFVPGSISFAGWTRRHLTNLCKRQSRRLWTASCTEPRRKT